MAGAIAWLRTKAEARPDRFLTIEEGKEGAGTYLVKTKIFKGRLPIRMAYQVRDENAQGKLINTLNKETGEQVSEVLRIGGQYRSDFNNCEFFHTEYSRVETGSVLA